MDKSLSLSAQQLQIIKEKSTEYPFSGQFNELNQSGTYLCRQCGLALYRSSSKFHSGCGWPSFDNQIDNHVKQMPDPDGKRTEILCNRCNAHLGHIFSGEQFTPNNIRHCVNSISLDFVVDPNITDSEEIILAAGCFWGVEYLFQQLNGIVKTECGYIGGSTNNPIYKEICHGDTGHLEAVRIIFDRTIIPLEAVIKYFFEIHDPSQRNRQGPDIGNQYHSAVFYYTEEQKQVTKSLIQELEQKKISIATSVLPMAVFWPAEDYHQNYYNKQNKLPYCHFYQKKF